MVILLSCNTAGNWKQSDFPEPVGIEINTSFCPVKYMVYKYLHYILKCKISTILDRANTNIAPLFISYLDIITLTDTNVCMVESLDILQ